MEPQQQPQPSNPTPEPQQQPLPPQPQQFAPAPQQPEPQQQPLPQQPQAPQYAAPANYQQQPTGPQQPGYPAPASGKTDVMGIVSIILAVCGLSLIGLIVGLIGVKQAKQEGRNPILSKIGWILSLVFAILGLLWFIFFFVVALQENATQI